MNRRKFAVAAALLPLPACTQAHVAAPHAAKDVEPLPGGSTTAPSDGVHTNGQGPTTSTVTATSAPPDTEPVTIVPFELPETPTTQTDQQWWQSQPGYDDQAWMACVRAHESDTAGGYSAVSPAGTYRGAYQFDSSTWADAVAAAGYPEYAGTPANLAPPAVQDAAAIALHAARGMQPWSGSGC